MLDYDDLLLYFAQMLAEPEIAAEIAAVSITCWSTNSGHQRPARRDRAALRPRGAGLTVVGDDAQSIYSFRAATVRNILDFPRSFDPPARIVTLDRNYRSTQADSRRRQCGDRARPRALRQGFWTERTHGRRPALVTVTDEADQARFVATPCSPIAKGARR